MRSIDCPRLAARPLERSRDCLSHCPRLAFHPQTVRECVRFTVRVWPSIRACVRECVRITVRVWPSARGTVRAGVRITVRVFEAMSAESALFSHAGFCAVLFVVVLFFPPCSVAMRDEPTMADDDRRRSPFRTLRKSRLHQAATSHASRHIAAISAEQAWWQTKRRNFSSSVRRAIHEKRSRHGMAWHGCGRGGGSFVLFSRHGTTRHDTTRHEKRTTTTTTTTMTTTTKINQPRFDETTSHDESQRVDGTCARRSSRQGADATLPTRIRQGIDARSAGKARQAGKQRRRATTNDDQDIHR